MEKTAVRYRRHCRSASPWRWLPTRLPHHVSAPGSHTAPHQSCSTSAVLLFFAAIAPMPASQPAPLLVTPLFRVSALLWLRNRGVHYSGSIGRNCRFASAAHFLDFFLPLLPAAAALACAASLAACSFSTCGPGTGVQGGMIVKNCTSCATRGSK